MRYSNIIQEINDEKLYSLNNSINNLIKEEDSLKFFKNIEFELEGSYSEKTLKLWVVCSMKNGESTRALFSAHVDEGAISLNQDEIRAYFGEEIFEKYKNELSYGSLDFEFINKESPDLANQLSESYLINCTPNVDNGAEFTKEDQMFFQEISKNTVKPISGVELLYIDEETKEQIELNAEAKIIIAYGNSVDYPIQYQNGEVAFDEPDKLSSNIKNKVKEMFNK